MSEHTRHQEHHTGHEHVVDHEHARRVEQQQAVAAEAAKTLHNPEDLARIREQAEKHSNTGENVRPKEQPDSESDHLFGEQHQLKATAYKRTLSQVQRKLPRPVRSFSKLVHNPAVDTLSAVGAQTVARPSGLLGGSLCAFLGTTIFWYYSKHYGFRYNFSIMLAFFIGGFAAGLVLEVLVWLVYSRRSR